MISTLDYTVSVGEVSNMASSVTFGAEPNDDTTKAVTLKYGKDSTSKKYYISEIYGAFDSATDVDVYSLTIPSDYTTAMAGQRLVGYLDPFPTGTDGNGSTAKTGKMYLVDAADMTKHVAEIDASLGKTIPELSPPITLGKQYYLFVERPAGATAGANDFYWFAHYVGGSNPLESTTAHNTAATAQVLKNEMQSGSLAQYFVDGDISAAGTEADYYSLSLPSGAKSVTVVCGAQRSGSGLRGFKASIFKSDGTTPLAATGSTGTEDAMTDLSLQDVPVGTATGTVIVKVEAASQDPNVTSTFYRCGMYVN
jgi:hypothetical protein